MLGQLGSSQAVPPLLELLKDSNSEVRKSAAEALWYLGISQGIKPFYIENKLPSAIKKSIESLEPLKNNLLQQINTGQTSSVLATLELLYSRLKEDNIYIQRAVVITLEEILRADKKSIPLSTQAEVATPSTVSNTSVSLPVTVKPPLSSKSLPDYKVDIQAKLAGIISDSKAMFGLQGDALKAITALGTEEVVQIILKGIAQEKISDKDNPLVLTAFQAMGDNGHPAALPFLQQQLQNLTDRKQQWRQRRDNQQTETKIDTALPCDKQSSQPLTTEENTWQQESWEFELGYAMTRIDPKMGMEKLLRHPLTKVRQGAVEGLATVATGELVKQVNGQREEILQAGIQWVDQAIFVQAAYRAIDRMLRTLEETGTRTDWEVLQAVLKETKNEAVRARLEWTVGVVGDRVGP